MKLSEIIQQIENGLFNKTPIVSNLRAGKVAYGNALNAVKNLEAWALKANDVLIAIESVHSEKLSNHLLAEVSPLIDLNAGLSIDEEKDDDEA